MQLCDKRVYLKLEMERLQIIWCTKRKLDREIITASCRHSTCHNRIRRLRAAPAVGRACNTATSRSLFLLNTYTTAALSSCASPVAGSTQRTRTAERYKVRRSFVSII